MAESCAHRELVVQLAKILSNETPHLHILTDVQLQPGAPVPPKIRGYRPDVYATNQNSVVIAEAKTDKGLDNQHTFNQVKSFITYLERKKNGRFILSVNGTVADRAKTLLRFICLEVLAKTTNISVFDGYDFWRLDLGGGRLWHLS